MEEDPSYPSYSLTKPFLSSSFPNYSSISSSSSSSSPSWPTHYTSNYHPATSWLYPYPHPHPLQNPPPPPPPNFDLNNQSDDVEPSPNATRQPLFEKPLTPSDVGKLNRLVIPKQHAEKYFPLAGDSVDKGLLLSFEDESGKCWRFRYSYWNSSQSYVLTKGWSRYVREKQLDAGDVVLFERHRMDGDRYFIGWRRRGDGRGSSSSGVQGAMYSRGSYNSSSCNNNNTTFQQHELGGLQFQTHSAHHAGATADHQDQRMPAAGNSKRLRLFGVNLESQPDHHDQSSEPSTPDGSSPMRSQGLSQHQHLYYYS